MDKVVRVMLKYSRIHIVATSYADSRIVTEGNLDLSATRAKSTIDYSLFNGFRQVELKPRDMDNQV